MERLCNDAVKILRSAIKAVKPETLIQKAVQVTENSELHINNEVFPISGNLYMVGFGKAVLGMAAAMENVLGKHLTSGIISVPKGIRKQMESNGHSVLREDSKIKVFEGAENNLPDDDALHAACLISDLVSSLVEADLLLVLISGGGSALLPSPSPGISLQEKLQLIKMLSGKGATVQELNVIRKRLSTLKGGGLAELAKPAKVVSLILSDIIRDPLDLIASAPTVKNTDDPSRPLAILKKYDLTHKVSDHIISTLRNAKNTTSSFDHVTNIIIGNNEVAVRSAVQMAQEYGYEAEILTLELQGEAKMVGKTLILMASALVANDKTKLKQATADLKLSESVEDFLLHAATHADKENKDMCLLCSGETVVEVKGTGLGGRNQELALAAALELHKREDVTNVVLLSAGTDGIDGPTSAAGAMATPNLVKLAAESGLNATEFLDNNDSFTFYQHACNRKWHVITGHTGTNVMDIVMILIRSG